MLKPKPMAADKLFLLDAMALIYRAYYALIRSPRITSYGKNTNAQFGFTTTLVDLLRKEQPSHIAVCFDTHAPTERHTQFENYKANRQAAPEDLLEAIPDIKKIIAGFNIACIELDGYEADDIIGTLAWKAAQQPSMDIFMVTPDKDYGQLLIYPNIAIYKPSFMGNREEILTAESVCQKWDITKVEQVIDMIGLMGDAVDNIPGVAGIGEKTASKLLRQYHSIEQIYANLQDIKGSLHEKLQNGQSMAILSKQLATINTQVPIVLNISDCRVKPLNTELLEPIFKELEFNALGKRILGNDFKAWNGTEQRTTQSDLFAPAPADEEEQPTAAHHIHNTPHQYQLLTTLEELKTLLPYLQTFNQICFDTETTSLDNFTARLVGLSFSVVPSEAYYVHLPTTRPECLTFLETLNPLWNNETLLWIGQNMKFDWGVLLNYGITPKGTLFDTMIAHYLIDPEGKHSMDLMSVKYLNYEPISIEQLLGKKGKFLKNMGDLLPQEVADYAAEDADITLQLKQLFEKLLTQKNLDTVFYTVEMPLIHVLLQMEREGVHIDTIFLKKYAAVLESEAVLTEQKIYDLAQTRFNIASPKQLGAILFDQLKIDAKAKKTKSGQYATGEEVLQKLAAKHPIANEILFFRELTKLKNTYVDAIPLMINPQNQRVHTAYNQAVAVTGRLSSNNPNLQNIPIRTERGREIRKAFIARNEHHRLISADYSQIELRIVAALSGDEAMCAAFNNNQDIHTATAAKVYNVSYEQVTKEQRYKAKSVNFGIIYGQSAFGLAENLNIERSEAKIIIDNYKLQFPQVQQFIAAQIAFAQQNGFVQTLMGRKRWLRDINSSNFVVRGFAERNAINMPIQGTAADMIKLAMIKIHQALEEKQLQTKMLLQVHDELVFDTPLEEVDQVTPLIIECMQSALILPNGIVASAQVGQGNNWWEAH